MIPFWSKRASQEYNFTADQITTMEQYIWLPK